MDATRLQLIGASFFATLRAVAAGCPIPIWSDGYSCTWKAKTCQCDDIDGFFDAYGYGCSDFDENCITLVEDWEYTPDARDEVILNCPRACGICSCEVWTGCFKREDDPIVNETAHARAHVNGTVLRITPGGWFSSNLLHALFKMLTSELLGYQWELATDSAQVKLEEYSPRSYLSYESFPIGYNSKESVYFAGVQQTDTSFEHYRAHKSAHAQHWFPAQGTFKLNNSDSNYIPSVCIQNRTFPCMELLHAYSARDSCGDYHRCRVERLFNNSDFPYHIVYAGHAALQKVVDERMKEGKANIFTWYEPDPFLLRIRAHEVAFPYEFSRCGDPRNGWGAAVECDCPQTKLYNKVSSSLRKTAAEIYYLISTTFRISLLQLQDMMARHKFGGGREDRMKVIACTWMKENIDTVRGWLPFCSIETKAYILADGSLACCNGSLVELESDADGSEVWKPLTCIPNCDRYNEAPDILSSKCRKRCPEGTVLDRDTDECRDCPSGTRWISLDDPFYTGVVAACRLCDAGTIQRQAMELKCSPCLPGRFSDVLGGTACILCDNGAYQAEAGMAQCSNCTAGMYTSKYGSAECQRCPKSSYASTEASTSCTACPDNTGTDTEGHADVLNCVCVSGHVGPAGEPCLPCAAGSFSNAIGQSTCHVCPAGKYIAVPGSSMCDTCPKNTYAKSAGAAQCDDTNCGLLQSSAEGSRDCELTPEGVLCIVLLVAILLMSSLAFFAVMKTKIFYKALFEERRERELQERLKDGLKTVKHLAHPLVLISATTFQDFSLEALKALHEGCRNVGLLVFLDTVEAVNSFKERNNFIMFFSYQWLSRLSPGPDDIQLQCMQAALDQLTELPKWRDLELKEAYIWLDILSIPQSCSNLKSLAVYSLYTFARLADIFIICAPESSHKQLKIQANSLTYKSRVWCRAEQMAFYCCKGAESMCLMRGPDRLSAVGGEWIQDVVGIFDGDMTCCSEKHPGGAECDRSSLVAPLIGMYFDLYVTQQAQASDNVCESAYALISLNKAKAFPRSFTYINEDGRATEKELFGDMISRIEAFVNRDLKAATKLSNALTYNTILSNRRASTGRRSMDPVATGAPTDILQNHWSGSSGGWSAGSRSSSNRPCSRVGSGSRLEELLRCGSMIADEFFNDEVDGVPTSSYDAPADILAL